MKQGYWIHTSGKKKGWDIPVTDGTLATAGDIAGTACLAALF